MPAQRYIARQLITLDADTVVRITAAQARRRAGRLTTLNNGRYRLNEALQFKAGESFALEGELPRALTARVEAVDTAKSGA